MYYFKYTSLNITHRVDRAIRKILYSYGPQTFNKLYELVNNEENCAKVTFSKHLNYLVQEDAIIKKQFGQYTEFSISKSENRRNDEIILPTLEKLKKDIEYIPIIKQRLNKFTKSKFKILDSKDRFELYIIGYDCAKISANWIQPLFYLIKGGLGSPDIKEKAITLQKKLEFETQEIFKIIRKKDPSITTNIFKDLLVDFQKVK